MKNRQLLLAFVTVAGCMNAAATEDRVYLVCEHDGPGKRAEHVLDKRAMTLEIVGVSVAAPVKETEHEYVASEVFQGQMIYRIAINKFTLRYSTYSFWPTQETFHGQCTIRARQL